jgi:hypothetical protein
VGGLDADEFIERRFMLDEYPHNRLLGVSMSNERLPYATWLIEHDISIAPVYSLLRKRCPFQGMLPAPLRQMPDRHRIVQQRRRIGCDNNHFKLRIAENENVERCA